MVFDRFKKKSLQITCPACQETQIEPPMAMSTYCRNCGEHLRIVKGNAQLTSGPQLSGISKVREVSDLVGGSPTGAAPEEFSDSEEESDEPNPGYWVRTNRAEREKNRRRREERRKRAEAAENVPSPAPETEPSPIEVESTGDAGEKGEIKEPSPDREPPQEASVAEVFGLAPGKTGNAFSSDSEVSQEAEEEEPSTLGTEASSTGDLTQGSMAAMISDLVKENERNGVLQEAKESAPHLAKKKSLPNGRIATGKTVLDRDYRSKSHIRVRCFRCHHCQNVSIHAESTQCGRCNTYISLADFQIRQSTDRVIRTRGNVVVHRRGAFVGKELACRDLLVLGTISTAIDCSGEARFKNSALVHGNLFAEKLVVERGAEIEFPDGVYTEAAVIHGTLHGNVVCAGPVEVLNSGTVYGNVTAHEIDLQGGIISGEMEIDRELKNVLPEQKGYDPSIID